MAKCNVFIHKPVDFKFQHLTYPGMFTLTHFEEMRPRKYKGGQYSASIIEWFKNNKPNEEFEELTSEWTFHDRMKKINQRSIVVGLF